MFKTVEKIVLLSCANVYNVSSQRRQHNNTDQIMDLAGLSEMDAFDPQSREMDSFEPQTRARSNTWPLPRPDNYVEGGSVGGENHCPVGTQCLPEGLQGAVLGGVGGAAKKNSSRRNAWGNLSYADLITQAITTAPDKRLTLSQIYEYMVHNVPYFKDKGDSNSSAGWKNSIRHNLSLHNRFMRVQNEGTGKSSWWMINPDAKPGKSARRRATSMETSKFEKRRGRVKKKVEALRNGLTLDHTPSPSSSVSEGLDLFPDSPLHTSAGFQLSPDFRPRASSNASSCGRLSPIPAVLGEQDWSSPGFPTQYGPEQLSANLADGMKLHQDTFCMNYPPPPPYTSTYEPAYRHDHLNSLHGASPYGLSQCPLHRLQPCSCMQPAGMSPSYPQSEPSPDPQFAAPARIIRRNNVITAQTPEVRTPITMMGQLMGALNNSTSTLLDELNINIETLHGGFDCNVDEVIKHELSMDGSLDFNFPAQNQHHHHHPGHHNHHHHHHQAITTQESQLAPPQTTVAPYTTSVASSGHWVH